MFERVGVHPENSFDSFLFGISREKSFDSFNDRGYANNVWNWISVHGRPSSLLVEKYEDTLHGNYRTVSNDTDISTMENTTETVFLSRCTPRLELSSTLRSLRGNEVFSYTRTRFVGNFTFSLSYRKSLVTMFDERSTKSSIAWLLRWFR